jgi:hypothetical protein
MPVKKKIGYSSDRFVILKKITSEAKKIRKKDSSLSWQDAIKKAGAMYRKDTTKKVSGVKKVAKKKVIKKAAVKKPAVKKVIIKKAAVKKTAKHKDVKSHNVNIKVVSGVKSLETQRAHLLNSINKANGDLFYIMDERGVKNRTRTQMAETNKKIKWYKEHLKTLKLHLKEINGLIAKSF